MPRQETLHGSAQKWLTMLKRKGVPNKDRVALVDLFFSSTVEASE